MIYEQSAARAVREHQEKGSCVNVNAALLLTSSPVKAAIFDIAI